MFTDNGFDKEAVHRTMQAMVRLLVRKYALNNAVLVADATESGTYDQLWLAHEGPTSGCLGMMVAATDQFRHDAKVHYADGSEMTLEEFEAMVESGLLEEIEAEEDEDAADQDEDADTEEPEN